jgi:selenide,water dikinase
MWTFPGGASVNRLYFESSVRFGESIDEANRMLLFDPQTSGGLLLCVAGNQLEAFMEKASEINQPAWVIGEVVQGKGIEVM